MHEIADVERDRLAFSRQKARRPTETWARSCAPHLGHCSGAWESRRVRRPRLSDEGYVGSSSRPTPKTSSVAATVRCSWSGSVGLKPLNRQHL